MYVCIRRIFTAEGFLVANTVGFVKSSAIQHTPLEAVVLPKYSISTSTSLLSHTRHESIPT